jgi:hypothetical protein
MDCSYDLDVSEMLSTREKKPGEDAYDIVKLVNGLAIQVWSFDKG